MLDYIFTEKYETEMQNIKTKISAKTYNDLESFFINTNLDKKQRANLLKIMSNVFSDGELNGTHNSLNSTIDKVDNKKEARPKSWEF